MATTVTVYQVDVFTRQINQGNPAGVVLDTKGLTPEQMQKIAKKVGFNETVFVLPSKQADICLKYFTPGHETPLCGHATLGAVYYLFQIGKINERLTIETGVGLLKIQINEQAKIIMEQDHPQTLAFKQENTRLCELIGIEESDLDQTLPIEYGNTGSWTLLVPVKNEQVLAKMKPKTDFFPEVLKEIPRSSIHPFAITDKNKKLFIARHFSSPFSGTVEDSVTGTASGVMGAYFQKYLYPDEASIVSHIRQGTFISKTGEVTVYVEARERKQWVKIAGHAVLNPKRMNIHL